MSLFSTLTHLAVSLYNGLEAEGIAGETHDFVRFERRKIEYEDQQKTVLDAERRILRRDGRVRDPLHRVQRTRIGLRLRRRVQIHGERAVRGRGHRELPARKKRRRKDQHISNSHNRGVSSLPRGRRGHKLHVRSRDGVLRARAHIAHSVFYAGEHLRLEAHPAVSRVRAVLAPYDIPLPLLRLREHARVRGNIRDCDQPHGGDGDRRRAGRNGGSEGSSSHRLGGGPLLRIGLLPDLEAVCDRRQGRGRSMSHPVLSRYVHHRAFARRVSRERQRSAKSRDERFQKALVQGVPVRLQNSHPVPPV